MTKETFEYTIETCDICKRRVKKEAKKKENSDYSFTLSNYSISTATWFPDRDLIKSKTENIDMCDACENSFKKWRANREDRCGCADY